MKKKTEENLTHTDTPLLMHLADALPGVSYCLQVLPEYKITYISRTALALFGYQKEELHACNNSFLLKLVHHEDHEIFGSKTKLVSQPDQSRLKAVEYRVYNRAGVLKWVKDQFTGVWDQDGNLVAMEGYIHEVTRPAIKTQLLSQLVAYRNAIDVNIISSITDLKGTILYVNKIFCDVSQYAEDELLGRNHNIVNSGLHPKSFFADLWKTIAAGKPWHGEIVNRAKDGSLYWVDSVIIPVFNERKEITSYLSLRTLITDRKKSEQQKDGYIKMLEEIAYLVAHRVRGPVCSILGLTQIMSSGTYREAGYVVKAIEYLAKSAKDLDEFTRELSEKIYSGEVELRIEEYRDKIKASSNNPDLL